MTATKKTVITILLLGVFFLSALYVVFSSHQSQDSLAQSEHLVAGSEFSGSVAKSEEKPLFNREQFVADMREAVLERQPDAIVITTPDTLETGRETFEEQQSEEIMTGERQVRWCDATLLESKFLTSWPSAPVAVTTAEGALVFSTAAEVSVGTTTETQTIISTLAQFPLNPAKTVEPSCLMHSYVGVTLDGRLIHNNDTILFANRTESEQIGYAFDGNPIYGVATEPERLDVCGGSDASGVYRYQLREDENFVLGCFVSTPQQNLQRG